MNFDAGSCITFTIPYYTNQNALDFAFHEKEFNFQAKHKFVYNKCKYLTENRLKTNKICN